MRCYVHFITDVYTGANLNMADFAYPVNLRQREACVILQTFAIMSFS